MSRSPRVARCMRLVSRRWSGEAHKRIQRFERSGRITPHADSSTEKKSYSTESMASDFVECSPGQFLARFTNKFSRKWEMYLMAMLGAAQ